MESLADARTTAADVGPPTAPASDGLTIFLAHAESEKRFVARVKDAIVAQSKSSRVRALKAERKLPSLVPFYDKDDFSFGRESSLIEFSRRAAGAGALLLFVPGEGIHDHSFVRKELLAFLTGTICFSRFEPDPNELTHDARRRAAERIKRVLIVDRHSVVEWRADGTGPAGLPAICRSGCLRMLFADEQPRLRYNSGAAADVATAAIALAWGLPPETVRSRVEAQRRARLARAVGITAVVMGLLAATTTMSLLQKSRADGRRLAAQSEALVDQQPSRLDLAVDLARDAARLDSSPEALHALWRAASLLPDPVRARHFDEGVAGIQIDKNATLASVDLIGGSAHLISLNTGAELYTLTAAGGSALSTDGLLFGAVDRTGTLVLLHTKTGTKWSFPAPDVARYYNSSEAESTEVPSRPIRIAFVPEHVGEVLYVVGETAIATARPGEPSARFVGATDWPINRLVVSRQGRAAAAVERGRRVAVWKSEAEQWRPWVTLEHNAQVWDAVFDQAESKLFVLHESSILESAMMLTVWQMPTAPCSDACEAPPSSRRLEYTTRRSGHDPDWLPRRALALSPNGRILVLGAEDGTVRALNADTLREEWAASHRACVNDVEFLSGSNRYVLTAGYEDSGGSARIWDATTGRELARMPVSSGAEAAASAPGGVVACGGGDKTLRTWRVDRLPLYPQSEELFSYAFARTGEYVAIDAVDGARTVWHGGRETVLEAAIPSVSDVKLDVSGEQIWRLDRASAVLASRRFTEDGLSAPVEAARDVEQLIESPVEGRLLFVRDGKGELTSLDRAHGAITLETFEPSRDRHLVCNRRRTMVASLRDDAILVWHATSGQLIHLFSIAKAIGYGLAFAPDDQWLAMAGDDGGHLWDLRTERAADLGGLAVYRNVTFSPDGAYLVAVDREFCIVLWSIADRSLKLRIRLTPGYYAGLDVSLDGRALAVGCEDGTVRIFDLPSGDELLRLAYRESVQRVFFVSDLLVVQRGDGTVEASSWRRNDLLSGAQRKLDGLRADH
jgi:WD40 repeat protein